MDREIKIRNTASGGRDPENLFPAQLRCGVLCRVVSTGSPGNRAALTVMIYGTPKGSAYFDPEGLETLRVTTLADAEASRRRAEVAKDFGIPESQVHVER